MDSGGPGYLQSMPASTGSLIRAAGAVVASILPRRRRIVRAVVLGGSDVAARQFDPGAVQLLSLDAHGDVQLFSTGSTPATDRNPALSEATAAASWVFGSSLVAWKIRKLPWPVRMVVAGGLAYGGGELLGLAHERFAGSHLKVEADIPAEQPPSPESPGFTPGPTGGPIPEV